MSRFSISAGAVRCGAWRDLHEHGGAVRERRVVRLRVAFSVRADGAWFEASARDVGRHLRYKNKAQKTVGGSLDGYGDTIDFVYSPGYNTVRNSVDSGPGACHVHRRVYGMFLRRHNQPQSIAREFLVRKGILLVYDHECPFVGIASYMNRMTPPRRETSYRWQQAATVATESC